MKRLSHVFGRGLVLGSDFMLAGAPAVMAADEP